MVIARKSAEMAGWLIGVAMVAAGALHATSSALSSRWRAFEASASPAFCDKPGAFKVPRPWQPISPLSLAAKHLRLAPVVRRSGPTASYKRTFRFFLAHPEITDRYDEIIRSWALARSLDARLVKAIIAAESQFSPLALSPTGARGLMQVMPKTAFIDIAVLPDELYDAEANIEAGTGYLEKLFAASWTIYALGALPFDQAPHALRQRIIAAYYAGPKNLSRHHRFAVGTRAYVRKVLLYYHSSVTDFRRPPVALAPRPSLSWSHLLGSF